MKLSKSVWAVVSLTAVLAVAMPWGCKQDSSDSTWLGGEDITLRFDEARLEREISRLAEKAVESKAVDDQLDSLFTTLGEAPEVASAGDALLEAIGAAPTLEPHFSKMVNDIGASPKVQASLKKLKGENPAMSEDELVAVFVKRVETNTDGAAFNSGFDTEFDKLLNQPDVDRVFEKFGTQVAESSHLEKAIDSVVQQNMTDRDWARRLTKLNGGKLPNKQQTTDLVVQHVFTEKRLEAFYVELFGLPAARKHVQQAAAELLRSPSFKAHIITAVETLFADPSFQKDALAGLMLLMSETLTEAEVAAAVGKLTTHPLMKKALVKLIDDILADPTLKQVGDKALKNISVDPTVRQAITKLVNGW